MLVELSFLSADYNADEMAYISRMVKDAGERVHTMEEARKYIQILRKEYSLKDLSDPVSIEPDRIRDVLAAMREQKK